MRRKLKLGKVVVTLEAVYALSKEDIKLALARHERRGRGCRKLDRREKNYIVWKDENGGYSSIHHDPMNRRFCIKTKPDSSLTMVNLEMEFFSPSELKQK